MPTGLRGLLLAVMMAALMSSLTSVFNSASTLFTCDLWQKIRKNASERELMIVGRVFILIMVGISVAWVPIVQVSANGQLFDYIQSITSYLGPPIMVIFVMAIFWPRLNEPGAFWALMCGLAVGVTRMIMDFVYGAPLCGQDEFRPEILYKVHYLYFAMILATITAIIAVVISLITPAIPKEKLIRLTWYTRNSKEPRLEMEELNEESKLEPTRSMETGFSNKAVTGDDGEVVHNGDNAEEEPAPKTEVVQTPSSQKWYRKAFDIFCGLDKSQSQEPNIPPPAFYSIEEEPLSRNIVNFLGLLMLCTMTFLFGYYA